MADASASNARPGFPGRDTPRGLTFRLPAEPPATGLTASHELDSYQTMFVGPAKPGHLAPGQFERIAKALADPRRFGLLQTIAESENLCAYQQLCRDSTVTKATISHHLKELVTAGLVETERDGQFVHARLVPGVIDAYAAELTRRVAGGA